MIAGDGYIFSRDAETDLNNTWFSLATSVDIAPRLTPSEDWKTSRAIRTSGSSPFLAVSHRMYVTLVCTYDITRGANPERVTERLRFHVPLKFVRVPPCSPESSRASTPTVVGHVRSASDSSDTASITTLSALLPPDALYASSLPPYSHLYHANGDRKIDYSIPLPLYTPRQEPNPQEGACYA